jgi:hypothetical protein
MNLDESEIEFREITDGDIPAVAGLLSRGFPKRKSGFWTGALEHLRRHQPPTGYPRLGYLIEQHGVTVGVVLTIYANIRSGGVLTTRCNPCAWYVEEPFRAYAGLLLARVMSRRNVTYLNVSPAPHTRQTIEALGFSRYCAGKFMAIPLLNRRSGREEVKVFTASHRPTRGFDRFEQELLAEHAGCGCISLWCETEDRAYPFVFRPRRIKGFIPAAQLLYCRAIEEFVQFARPIGRFLARRGRFVVILDADSPIPGLTGLFRTDTPKYFRGPQPPRLGDLAYTEFAVLGV